MLLLPMSCLMGSGGGEGGMIKRNRTADVGAKLLFAISIYVGNESIVTFVLLWFCFPLPFSACHFFLFTPVSIPRTIHNK